MINKAFRFARVMQSQGVSPLKMLGVLYHAPSFIKLFSRLLKDPRVPFHLKALCYGSFAYLLLPIDLLKDFPFFYIGYIDDMILIFMAFRKLLKDSPPEVVREHVQAISQGQ